MTTSFPLAVVPVVDVLGGRVVRAQRGEQASYRPIVSPLAAGSDPATARALLSRYAPAAAPVLYVADLGDPGRRAAGPPRCRHWAAPGRPGAVDRRAGFAGARHAGVAPGARAAGRALARGVRQRVDRRSGGAGRPGGRPARHPLARCPARPRPLDPAGCWQRPHAWPGTVVVMTLDRVGADAGPDLDTFARLRALAPERRWIGAGGVRDAGDLAAAAAAEAPRSWLVASALHDGRIRAPRAMRREAAAPSRTARTRSGSQAAHHRTVARITNRAMTPAPGAPPRDAGPGAA